MYYCNVLNINNPNLFCHYSCTGSPIKYCKSSPLALGIQIGGSILPVAVFTSVNGTLTHCHQTEMI